MQHDDIVKAIQFIKPESEFVLTGDDLTWLDENQTEPSKKEIENAWVAYQKNQKLQNDEKEAARQAILDRLGLTADEAKLLLG